MGFTYIDFDAGQARAARDACWNHAAAIDQFIAEVRRQGVDTGPAWDAGTYDTFMAQLTTVLTRFTACVDALRAASGAIARGIEGAYEEEARQREAERRREEERQREEDARRRQQSGQPAPV